MNCEKTATTTTYDYASSLKSHDVIVSYINYLISFKELFI